MKIKRKTTNSLADCIKNIASCCSHSCKFQAFILIPTCKFQKKKSKKTKTKTAFYANEFVFRINIDWKNNLKKMLAAPINMKL